MIFLWVWPLMKERQGICTNHQGYIFCSVPVSSLLFPLSTSHCQLKLMSSFWSITFSLQKSTIFGFIYGEALLSLPLKRTNILLAHDGCSVLLIGFGNPLVSKSTEKFFFFWFLAHDRLISTITSWEERMCTFSHMPVFCAMVILKRRWITYFFFTVILQNLVGISSDL